MRLLRSLSLARNDRWIIITAMKQGTFEKEIFIQADAPMVINVIAESTDKS